MDDRTAPFAQTLVAQSNGFLSDASVEALGRPDTVIASARYDLTALKPDLFQRLQVDMPPRLKRVVAKRQGEFLAGRAMVRLAMHALAVPDHTVDIGPDRAPIWPLGLTGSISHAKGLCLCLLSSDTAKTFGVDTEAIADDTSLRAITSQTLSDDDQRVLATTDDLPTNVAATLVFSAKEALFKALYPRVGHHFGFDAAVLDTRPTDGRLSLRLTRDLAENATTGQVFPLRYRLTDTHVITWLAA